MSMNSITKKYLVIMAILLCACQNHKSVILAKYPDGKIKTSIQYYDPNDTTKYSVKEYLQNGDLYHEASVSDGAFIGKKVKFYHNLKPAQIDSLFTPQIIGDKN